jgi:Mg-chelatase subunit ChlD
MRAASGERLFLVSALLTCTLTPAAAQDVTVESSAKAAQKSEEAAKLLRPPSERDNRYASSPDWREIPPWRQTSFYGLRAQGSFFVFVIDCSGSMAEEERWLRVRDEVRRTLARLQFPQRYYVLFYNDESWPMPGGMPASAGKRNVSRTLTWLDSIVPEGKTDPRGAMSEALALRPNAVFLLSDGEFPEGTSEAIAKCNTGKIPVHCVDLSGGAGGEALKKIAKDSGGQYVARP